MEETENSSTISRVTDILALLSTMLLHFALLFLFTFALSIIATALGRIMRFLVDTLM